MAGTDSLADLVGRKHVRAAAGAPGGGANCTGRSAADLVIRVPPGTVIFDRDRGNILRDLKEPDEEVIVAHGGRGGRGNKSFASPTNRTPRQYQPGEPGEERWLILELKVIADAGLVGLPNAGKSTLLSRLSQAHPEIADYPFTTKYPNLGMVQIGDENAFVLADLPGLIEGTAAASGWDMSFCVTSNALVCSFTWSSRSRAMTVIRWRIIARFAPSWSYIAGPSSIDPRWSRSANAN